MYAKFVPVKDLADVPNDLIYLNGEFIIIIPSPIVQRDEIVTHVPDAPGDRVLNPLFEFNERP